MSDTPNDLEWITEEKITEIVQAAAHEAAKSVNLSAQLTSINSRLRALEEQNSALSRSLVDHMKEEQDEMRMAVAEGIAEGLSRVALGDARAGEDVRELRSLLSAWNDVKAALWSKIKHIIAVAILGGIALMVSMFTNINPFNNT